MVFKDRSVITGIIKFQSTLRHPGAVVAMVHPQHGKERQCHKHCGIGEQIFVANVLHHRTAEDGGDNLGAHREGVVVAGIFAHIGFLTHFYHHGVGVDVDGGPAHPSQSKEEEYSRREGGEQDGTAKGQSKK